MSDEVIRFLSRLGPRLNVLSASVGAVGVTLGTIAFAAGKLDTTGLALTVLSAVIVAWNIYYVGTWE